LTVWNRAPRVPLGGEKDVPASPAGPEGYATAAAAQLDKPPHGGPIYKPMG